MLDELFGFGASQRQGEPEDGEAGAQHNEQEFRKGVREEGGGRRRQAHSTTSRNSGRVRGRSEEAYAQHNEQEFRKGEREKGGGRRTAQRAGILEG